MGVVASRSKKTPATLPPLKGGDSRALGHPGEELCDALDRDHRRRRVTTGSRTVLHLTQQRLLHNGWGRTSMAEGELRFLTGNLMTSILTRSQSSLALLCEARWRERRLWLSKPISTVSGPLHHDKLWGLYLKVVEGGAFRLRLKANVAAKRSIFRLTLPLVMPQVKTEMLTPLSNTMSSLLTFLWSSSDWSLQSFLIIFRC